MPKVREIKDYHYILFWCPGCEEHHGIPIHMDYYEKNTITQDTKPVWQYNENPDCPTVNPSLVIMGGGKIECHLFIENGKIRYLTDCTHKLAGQTVDMEEIE